MNKNVNTADVLIDGVKMVKNVNTANVPVDGVLKYNMTNDYMFRAVLQKNKEVLKGLVGSLLHLNPETIDVEITNPIALGRSIANKDFIMDINVIVNGFLTLNLEMQVVNRHNWKERSLSYLCRSFDTIQKGGNYKDIKPVIQISFLDFDLFPEEPEFYATYMMKNVKNGIVYTDKFQLSVVELNHIELATDEDCRYEIDKWAAFFKSKTWKELRAMAAANKYMESAVDTIFEISSDALIEEQCRIRAEYEADQRDYELQRAIVAEQKAIIAEKDKEIVEKDKEIVEKDKEIAMFKKILEEAGLLHNLLAQAENSK